MPILTPHRFHGTQENEQRFTLVELLVVVLIIGILAAIALPIFLGQKKKAQDASAKSNARNAVTQVEACLALATASQAAACGNRTANTGLGALGSRVAVTGASVAGGGTAYTITATSKSTGTFRIRKVRSGAVTYSATPVDAKWAANSTP